MERITAIKDRLTLVQSPPQTFSETSGLYECDDCSDSGFEVISGKGARPCGCRLTKIREQRLAKVPPVFAGVNLADIKPMPAKHKSQAEFVPAMLADPSASFYFSGRFGTGKSTFLWALYKHAVEQNRPKVVVCTLSELLNEYKAFIQASIAGTEPKPPRLNADELRQKHTRYAIFLDDLDKAKPTEYAAEQLFEIVNAIYDFRHQVVVTTNLSVGKLVDHFDRADERYGGAIVRRLTYGAKIVEMF